MLGSHRPGDGFVNVLLLGHMHAHERLDRLDHPLGVSDKIAVDPFLRQVLRYPSEQPREMQDLAMCAAHR